jgi:hypothetical protein
MKTIKIGLKHGGGTRKNNGGGKFNPNTLYSCMEISH